MTDSITIDPRFCGPPDSAPGGYTCGRVAAVGEGPAEVTLRRPPPLGRDLRIVHRDGGVALQDGDALVAEGAATSFTIDLPEPVSFREAEKASASFSFDDHWFPTCFACGPDRKAGDGLRIFPANVDGSDILAAPWTPDPSLADGNDVVRPEFIWSALDCPSGFAAGIGPMRLALLGRLALEIVEPVGVGQRCVITSWPLGSEGRKLYGASALFSEQGALHAYAKSTWILLEAPA